MFATRAFVYIGENFLFSFNISIYAPFPTMSDSGKNPYYCPSSNRMLNYQFISEMPELCKDNSDSENSDGWDELEGDDPEDNVPVPCLFCNSTYKNIKEAISHVEKDHKLSFLDLQIKFNMDQYSFIKVHGNDIQKGES